MLEILGALVPTFLISRLVLWTMKRWNGGALRLVVGNLFSALICGALGGLGYADGGPFSWDAFAGYAAIQIVWLTVDIGRYVIRSRKDRARQT